MTEFTGKVVLISGVARGMGRSHAIAFGSSGAVVVGVDSAADFEETVALVEDAGGTIQMHVADVRHGDELEAVVGSTLERFGQIDVAVANAGVGGKTGPAWTLTEQAFRDVLDVNLVGAWNLARVALPSMMERRTGSVVLISSGAAVKGLVNLAPYVASKHALVGLMRTMAKEVGPYGVRVNTVQPGNVNTPLLLNDATVRSFLPGEANPTKEDFAERARRAIPLRIPWVEPEDVTEAVLWLASDRARYVTGATIAVDGGGAVP